VFGESISCILHPGKAMKKDLCHTTGQRAYT